MWTEVISDVERERRDHFRRVQFLVLPKRTGTTDGGESLHGTRTLGVLSKDPVKVGRIIDRRGVLRKRGKERPKRT